MESKDSTEDETYCRAHEGEVCGICLDPMSAGESVVFPRSMHCYKGTKDWCDHSFCRGCYLQHVSVAVADRKHHIRCPQEGRSWEVDPTCVQLLLVGPVPNVSKRGNVH